jgi:hypothetical protein
MSNIKSIAFYLPQYHPIPENNKWWGPGFTEWTNVAKAKPLFKGHYQPNIPADLGFYDLRLEETRIAQANLAKKYGLTAFCYWHYWFGNGKRILERPFNEVLKSGRPDFPFCLGWANESWTGVWHGAPNKMLIKQTYPGKNDYVNHFYEVLPAFLDSRYFTIENKPLFLVYRYKNIPNIEEFINTWQNLAVKEGLNGVYFINMINSLKELELSAPYFNASILQENFLYEKKSFSVFDKITYQLFKKNFQELVYLNKVKSRDYKDFVKDFNNIQLPKNVFPTVLPNWDNTPRSGLRGFVLKNSSPELFAIHLKKVIKQIVNHPENQKIIFVKSWNEWAEGNYLEPDLRYGHKYLQTFKSVING